MLKKYKKYRRLNFVHGFKRVSEMEALSKLFLFFISFPSFHLHLKVRSYILRSSSRICKVFHPTTTTTTNRAKPGPPAIYKLWKLHKNDIFLLYWQRTNWNFFFVAFSQWAFLSTLFTSQTRDFTICSFFCSSRDSFHYTQCCRFFSLHRVYFDHLQFS